MCTIDWVCYTSDDRLGHFKRKTFFCPVNKDGYACDVYSIGGIVTEHENEEFTATSGEVSFNGEEYIPYHYEHADEIMLTNDRKQYRNIYRHQTFDLTALSNDQALHVMSNIPLGRIDEKAPFINWLASIKMPNGLIINV